MTSIEPQSFENRACSATINISVQGLKKMCKYTFIGNKIIVNIHFHGDLSL